MFEYSGMYLLLAIMALAISMASIPIMIKIAPRLGMVDQPDPRKVHTVPIPRVGGIGIIAGALVPLFIWQSVDSVFIGYYSGAVVLAIFGIWDDANELGHYIKFVGQIIAAMLVVYLGDVYVVHFPFIGAELLPEAIGRPFTVVAIVGMINAINHSDGLDGLAGGEALISLAGIAYLSYHSNGEIVLALVATCAGGIFGFLRFNSHPAKVFMGDGGSQFLGFTLAFIVILLTQDVNPGIGAALPVLLLGLPIVDILAVFYLRAKNKMNLFKATRNHIHHRLLALGFYHYESVIIIYSIQILFVVTAVQFPYESDYFHMGLYVGVCVILFSVLTYLERIRWSVGHESRNISVVVSLFEKNEIGEKVFYPLLKYLLVLFFAGSIMMTQEVPADIGYSSAILFLVGLFVVFTSYFGMLLNRLVIFISVGFAVYLETMHMHAWLEPYYDLSYLFYSLLAVLIFLSAKFSPSDSKFSMNPMDYLVILLALIALVLSESTAQGGVVTWLVIQLVILYYACEITIQKLNSNLNLVSAVSLLFLLATAVRVL